MLTAPSIERAAGKVKSVIVGKLLPVVWYVPINSAVLTAGYAGLATYASIAQ